MSDFLRTWIINITVIIIFIMFLDTIMPNNSMKRYINVVVGLLIIIVVIEPFVLVKQHADSFNNEMLETSNFIDQKGFDVDSKEISKYQQEKTVEIFESNLKGKILRLIENNTGVEYKSTSVELELEKDFESKDFGSIKSITVQLSNSKKAVIEVDRIKIGGNKSTIENKNVINEDNVEYNLNDSKISNEIKEVISNALGISESIVSVSVQH
jgi:stage III sporulation protein AF